MEITITDEGRKMRRIWIVIVAGLLLAASVPGALAGDIPPMPGEFYGNVTINGMPAPAGILIEARINGLSAGSLTTTTAGSYGGKGTFDPRLMVSGQSNGQVVSFFIGGLEANQTAVFQERSISRLDVTAFSNSTGEIILASTTAPTPKRTPVEPPIMYPSGYSPPPPGPEPTLGQITGETIPTIAPAPVPPSDTPQAPVQPDQPQPQTPAPEVSGPIQSTIASPVATEVPSSPPQPATTQSAGFSGMAGIAGIIIVGCLTVLRR